MNEGVCEFVKKVEDVLGNRLFEYRVSRARVILVVWLNITRDELQRVEEIASEHGFKLNKLSTTADGDKLLLSFSIF